MKALTVTAVFFVGVLQFVPCAHLSADTFGSGENSFEIDFVNIGNPGNPPDKYEPPPGMGGYGYLMADGRVDYEYRMGMYEISRDMVDKANLLGNLEIEMPPHDWLSFRGMDPDAAAGFINWFEAARFVNWLNLSTGHADAYNLSGDQVAPWQPQDDGYDADDPLRNANAKYFLPSPDEWHKAAYYDPVIERYHDFATGHDYDPANRLQPLPTAGGTADNTAVWALNPFIGPAKVTEAGGLSPYGTMAQTGNVAEWLEFTPETVDVGADTRSKYAPVMGWSWRFPNFNQGDAPWLNKYDDIGMGPLPRNIELVNVGFRVASKPDDSLPGDFNANGVLDVADIDDLTNQSAGGLHPGKYDLNHDALVDQGDVRIWIDDLFRSWVGDANLDREFSSSDLVVVLSSGTYESDVPSVWSTGDFNGDGRTGTADLVLALADGGYEQGPRPWAAAVPEPSGVLLIAELLPLCWTWMRRGACARFLSA
jgi:hypothetical protein